jgi:general secretion pathway protein M
MKGIDAVVRMRAQLRARWSALDERERRRVGLAAAVVVLALLWWIGIAPALRTLREAPPRLAELDQQLQEMRRLAGESQGLKGMPAIAPEQARRALESVTERLGPTARLSVQGERVTLSVQSARGDALWAWLSEARSAARVRPVEAQLTRSGDGYTGTIVVVLPGSGA